MNAKQESAQKKKIVPKKFVYDLVNQLNLHEFKKFTNIRELMQNALLKKDERERQKLEYYIKQNFKQNLPNEKVWMRGGFASLKFTSDFYETEVAQRAFQKVYGIKRCSVKLEKIRVNETQETEQHLQVDLNEYEAESGNMELENHQAEIVKVTSDVSEMEIEKIDLTKDDSDVLMYPPKRLVLKYPKKLSTNIPEPSEIVENVCETIFEEISPTQLTTSANVLNDEIVVSPTADNIPKRTNERPTIISNIILVNAPKAPQQKEIAHASKPNSIGPKSHSKASSSDCLTKKVSSKSPMRQIQLPIRLIQSPTHQRRSPMRDAQSPINQRQSAILQRQSALMIPEDQSSSQNSIQHTRESVTVIPQDITEPLPLNNKPTLDSHSQKQSETMLLKDSTESPSLLNIINNIRQVFNARISVIHHEFEKYLITTPSVNWSLRNFWANLKLDNQNDCTLLNSNVMQLDVNYATGDEAQNQSSIDMTECHPTNANVSIDENSATIADIEMKLEKMLESNGSDARNVEINDIPSDRPIVIVNVTTLDLLNDLNHNDSRDDANVQRQGESFNKSGSTAPSTSEGISLPGNEQSQNQSSIDVAECQATNANVSIERNVENSTILNDIEIKLEKMSESNASDGSDVEIIDVPPDGPIEIMDVSTQDLINNLELDRNESQDQVNFVTPFAIPQQIAESYKKGGSKVSSTSKGFLTALPNYNNKKRIYKPLNIAVQSLKDIPAVVLPNHDFSQQPDSTSPPENYEIEEFTMTESQIQRYELLNNENSLFVSSQLENYELNTGNRIVPKAHQATPILPTVTEPVTQKRPSSSLCLHPSSKRRRIGKNIVAHELHWKILNLKTFIFQPLSQNTFNLEIQLRNNFDKFHLNDQHSIKLLLNVSDKEWEHVVHILKALNGYEYQVFDPTLSQKSDVLHRVMDNFVRSIPVFVKSRIHFGDFMGSLLEVSEQLPLDKKCANSSIEPNLLKRMIEFKKNLAKM